MKLENQVCSLELSKRLKELGVKQHSYFEWLLYPEKMEWEVSHTFKNQLGYSAFTVAELGEMLPDNCIDEDNNEICWFYHDKNNNCHRISYVHLCDEICSPFIEVKGENEANARAKMLIYLLENKLMELPNE